MNEKKLRPADLMKGMYVCRLDRPWEGTPFPLQGLRIEGPGDIELLAQYCKYVYIDVDRTYSNIETDTPMTSKWADRGDETISDLKLTSYPTKTSLDEELPRAHEYRTKLLESINEMMDSVRLGEKINISHIEVGLNRVKESIFRNPSTFMLLRLLKQKDAYTYEHCVDVSALSIIFGRQIGLPREIIDDLALGAILFDIGKMRVPSEILNKADKLTEEESVIIRKHVEYGLSIVSDLKELNSPVHDIIATHHERYDGSGYPNGLQKNSIPILGRIVGIVDCYDAMTSSRNYCQAVPSEAVIRQLYSWRNKLFQDEIVEYFIQTVGIYPVGSVVELSNGEVGIVVSQNDLRRLRPSVMVVLDQDKKPIYTNRVRNLYYEIVYNDNLPLNIVESVEAEKYGLNPREYFF